MKIHARNTPQRKQLSGCKWTQTWTQSGMGIPNRNKVEQKCFGLPHQDCRKCCQAVKRGCMRGLYKRLCCEWPEWCFGLAMQNNLTTSWCKMRTSLPIAARLKHNLAAHFLRYLSVSKVYLSAHRPERSITKTIDTPVAKANKHVCKGRRHIKQRVCEEQWTFYESLNVASSQAIDLQS